MRKKIFFVVISLLIMGTMAGCSVGGNPTQASYISMDKAYTTALNAAGVDASSASVIETQLSEQNGIAYYKVNFNADGMEYDYSIDAITGVVIEAKTVNQNIPVDNTEHSVDYNVASTEEMDRSAANGDGAATTNSISPTPAAITTPKTATPSSTATEITLEQAKQVALDHAGKTESEVTFVKEHKDFDDRQWIYEIEFIVQSQNGYQEYDYDIHASTGKVLSYDYDAENYIPQSQGSASTQGQGSATKTEDEVRSIALAKVPGAKASDCSLWLEQDDGRLIYEGKIIYDLMEYEFEIDAYSGTVLAWDVESMFD